MSYDETTLITKWASKKLKDIANFNPRESIAKGTIAKKVAMDRLQPFCRDIPGYAAPLCVSLRLNQW